MKYTGEHLFAGQLGHTVIVLSLLASLAATIAFFMSNKTALPDKKARWLRIARSAFLIETVAVIVTIGCIYYILSHHLFEYLFAWEHSDKTLQSEYIFSCLWEGQEGSFLLWTFWNCVLGCVLMVRAKRWEAPVMMTVSFAQFCLATMILGWDIFGVKIGSDPFLLLRQTDMLSGAPAFFDSVTHALRTDYLQFITDGQGLNSTLQNYWMVIHPPMLFLGFASAVVPFAYAIAGLINKDSHWTKHSISWASFSCSALGLGIMMGAVWAYESLNFGGYWAWDPVENASLVPWLVMVAGLHTNVVYRRSKYSLKITHLLYILAFALVLYSTYLTRSGVLKDTSVHAFAGSDMNLQLIFFILVFLLPALTLFSLRWKNFPVMRKEESLYSREFWMFIGSLVLFLSGVIIIGKTSIPVFNDIFGTNIAEPADVLYSYNQIQIFFAILIGFLTATIQFFKYKRTSQKYLYQRLLLPTVASLVVAIVFFIYVPIDYEDHDMGFLTAVYIAVFAAIYAVIANIGYLILIVRRRVKIPSAPVSHIGFGLVLFGILLSSAQKTILSNNTTGMSLLEKSKDYNPAENITLFKNVPANIDKYKITYVKDTLNTKDRQRVFVIHFENKKTKNSFNLYPYLLKNNRQMEGYGATPDAKHFWNRDVYAFVSAYAPSPEDGGVSGFRPVPVKVGDTVAYAGGIIVLNKVDIKHMNKDTSAVQLNLDITVIARDGSRYAAKPTVLVNNDSVQSVPATIAAQGLAIRFNRVLDAQGNIEIGIKEKNAQINTAITLKVIEFPYIGILWMGVIVMTIGFWMSLYHHAKNRTVSTQTHLHVQHSE